MRRTDCNPSLTKLIFKIDIYLNDNGIIFVGIVLNTIFKVLTNLSRIYTNVCFRYARLNGYIY